MQNKACVGLWFSTNPPRLRNLFFWIHQSLPPPSPPWFINPRGTARLVTWYRGKWSNSPPPISGEQIPGPSGQEKASNARGMPGGGMLKVLFDWYLNLLKNKAQNKLIILKPEGILIKKWTGMYEMSDEWDELQMWKKFIWIFQDATYMAPLWVVLGIMSWTLWFPVDHQTYKNYSY